MVAPSASVARYPVPRVSRSFQVGGSSWASKSVAALTSLLLVEAAMLAATPSSVLIPSLMLPMASSEAAITLVFSPSPSSSMKASLKELNSKCLSTERHSLPMLKGSITEATRKKRLLNRMVEAFSSRESRGPCIPMSSSKGTSSILSRSRPPALGCGGGRFCASAAMAPSCPSATHAAPLRSSSSKKLSPRWPTAPTTIPLLLLLLLFAPL
mmetsp:Transcript_3623/g.13124  ORF Transcript_3623/g.13124 Transcript_3623/m.13124 type:complete len:212 (-) Transcript_3623:716-1351(-)